MLPGPVTSFDEVPFVAVNQQPLSLGRVLRYLQLSGRLTPLLRDIVSQHIVHETLQAQDAHLPVALEDVHSAIAQFREQQQLTDDRVLEQWLATQNMSWAIFQKRIILALKLEQLKVRIAAPDLHACFQQQQGLRSDADLCCILGGDRDLLHTIAHGLRQGSLTLPQVIETYERADPPQVTILRGVVQVAELPPELRSPVLTAPLGTYLGPNPVGHRWAVLRVERRILAKLDATLRQELQEQLFQQWLQQQLEQIQVTLGPDLPGSLGMNPLPLSEIV
jgi:hypothetical protein